MRQNGWPVPERGVVHPDESRDVVGDLKRLFAWRGDAPTPSVDEQRNHEGHAAAIGENCISFTLWRLAGMRRTEEDALHIDNVGWRADRREVGGVDGQVNGQVRSPFLQLRPGEFDV